VYTLAVTLSLLGTNGADPDGLDFFEKHIRPVLVERCYRCHNSTDQREAGLAVDHRAAIREGGDSGPAVVPGKPEESLLLSAIRDQDGLRMPKDDGRLSAEVVRDFADWIARGAPDPRDTPPTAEDLVRSLSWESLLQRRKKWWSFQPIVSVEPPAASGADASDHLVDRFIEAKIAAASLESAAPAGRREIVRRLSFVLTGLPPEPQLVEEFLADRTPESYERLVDRLLASPHFGERWARHWMDWFRYAESHGSEGDPEVPLAWRYRDYLIRALNADVPYDRLVREHIAGDLLAQPRTRDGLNESALGTGHFRFVQHGYAPTDILAERVRFTDDQIDVISKAFLGLTVSCARCHDHKFDPISQQDYYGLAGIFTSWLPAQVTLDTPERQDLHCAELSAMKGQLRERLAVVWEDAVDRLGATLLGTPVPPKIERPPPKTRKERKEARRRKENPDIPTGCSGALSEVWERGARSPLYAWVRLAAAAPGDRAQTWSEVAGEYRESRAGLERRAGTYARRWDLTGAAAAEWFRGGSGLRSGPSPSGDFHILAEGEQVVLNIYPAGIYTHLISNKHNGVLLSPRFQMGSDRVWIRALGGNYARTRYIMQNYPRTAGPIFDTEYLMADEFQWKEFRTKYWKGDDAHIELATSADFPVLKKRSGDRSWFGVTEIILGSEDDQPPREEPAQIVAPLFELAGDDPPANLEELAALYVESLRRAIRAWRTGEITDAQASYLGFFVKRRLLPNTLATLPEVEDLVALYRAREAQVPVPVRAPGLLPAGRMDHPLFVRGNHTQPRGVVPQRFLEVIDPTPYPPSTDGRLALARDLVRPDNPLTARVIVNRVWHHVFGGGIVATPDNFGHMGAKPTHPELLDALARRFVDDGWSLKRAIRMLVTSRTFRRSSVPSEAARHIDPENRLLSHMPVRRLEAEAIRDAMLAVSGQLEPKLFGPSIDGKTPRRSVYIEVRRNDLNPLMTTFDAPFPFSTTGRRTQTNLPAQSLALLNDPFVVGLADAWAARVLATAGAADGSDRVAWMYKTALGRPPSPRELERTLEFLESRSASSGEEATPEFAWQELAQAIFSFKEFIYVK